jgi:hypothetical protein
MINGIFPSIPLWQIMNNSNSLFPGNFIAFRLEENVNYSVTIFMKIVVIYVWSTTLILKFLYKLSNFFNICIIHFIHTLYIHLSRNQYCTIVGSCCRWGDKESKSYSKAAKYNSRSDVGMSVRSGEKDTPKENPTGDQNR